MHIAVFFYQLCFSNYIVRPSGAKKITMPSVQRNYIAMGPMMVDKADPSQELSV